MLDVDPFYTGPRILITRYSGETDAVQIGIHHTSGMAPAPGLKAAE